MRHVAYKTLIAAVLASLALTGAATASTKHHRRTYLCVVVHPRHHSTYLRCTLYQPPKPHVAPAPAVVAPPVVSPAPPTIVSTTSQPAVLTTGVEEKELREVGLVPDQLPPCSDAVEEAGMPCEEQ